MHDLHVSLGIDKGLGMTTDYQNGKVYVVDDDAAVRQAVALVLTRGGFETHTCSDAASLFRMMRRELPHCILLDLQLRGASGLDVLRQLRNEHYGTPVLMISGKGNIAEAVAALKLGADDFLQKPFGGAELISQVAACIARHAAPATRELELPGKQKLTCRERQVMAHCVRGSTAKETGLALGLSPRTVEDYRANLIRKFGAQNVAHMVHIVLANAAL